jgi:hypothetical protein
MSANNLDFRNMRSLQFWRSKWIVVGWLVSLVLVGLNIFTPVELVPLSLENVPRWGIYALVFLAYGFLQACWPRALPLADSAVARLGTAAGRTLFLAADDGGQTPTKSWSDILAPPTWLFARPEEWRTPQVLFCRGSQVVVQQRYVPWDQPLLRFRSGGRGGQLG